MCCVLVSWIFFEFSCESLETLSFRYFLFQGIRGLVGLPGPLGVKGEQVHKIKIVVCLLIFCLVLNLEFLVHFNMTTCLCFSLSLGTYWSTRTEGYTRDARTACKFHVQILFISHILFTVLFCCQVFLSIFNYVYSQYFFPVSFNVVYVVAFFYGKNFAAVFKIPFGYTKFIQAMHVLLFGSDISYSEFKQVDLSLRCFYSACVLNMEPAQEHVM